MCIKKKCTLNPVYNFNNNDAEKDRLVFDKIDFDNLIELIDDSVAKEEPIVDGQAISDEVLHVEKEESIIAAEVMKESKGIAKEHSKEESLTDEKDVFDDVLQSEEEDRTEDIDDGHVLEDSAGAAREPLDDLKAEALARKLVEGGKITVKGDNQIITNEVIR